jgi:GT2 family glycosyltransferase
MIKILIPTTKERRTRLNDCLNAVRDNSNYKHSILIYEGNDGGYVNAVHKMLEGISGLVCVIGDDMIPQKDWLKYLAEAYNDNLVFPDDGISNGKLATAFLCDADYLRKYLHKGYSHLYSDKELTEVSRLLGKLKYVPESKVIHNHWSTGSVKDQTYLSQDETRYKDRELFKSRKLINFEL